MIKTKKIVLVFLALVLTMSLIPTTKTKAYATGVSDSSKPMAMGMSGVELRNITDNGYKDPATLNIEGDKIVFGSYEDKPVEWAALGFADTNGDGEYTNEEGLFLLSTRNLGNTPFATEYEDNEVVLYSGSNSELRTYIESLYNGDLSMTNVEKSIIIPTILSAESLVYNVSVPGLDPLPEQKLFPISLNEFFAYVGHDTELAEADAIWWNRTAIGDRYILGVSSGGIGYSIYEANGRGNGFGVRPAFNLDTNAVLFTSAAVGGKLGEVGSFTDLSELTEPTTWKLTLKDTDRSFEVTNVHEVGETVTFDYTGAKTGINEYISVMIVDDSNNITHYAKVVDLNGGSTSGSVSFTLPDTFVDGDTVNLKFFNEQANGDNETDYSSDFVSKTITLNTLESVTLEDWVYGGTAKTPIVTHNGTQNGNDVVYTYSTTEDGAYSVVIPTDAGTYWVKASSTGHATVADKSVKSSFEITKSDTDFDGGIKTYKGSEATTTFTYGDTITIKVTPKATGVATRLAAPNENQMALYIGETQITEPKTVTNGEELTFTVNTVNKTIPSEFFTGTAQTLSAKYVGNDNMVEHEETVSITLNKKTLTATVEPEQEKDYDGDGDFTNVVLTLSGLETSDTITARASGTVSDVNVGTDKPLTVTSVTLGGDNKGYYSLETADVSSSTVDITATDYTGVTEINATAKYGTSGSVDLSAWAALYGVDFGEVTKTGEETIITGTPALANNTLRFTLADNVDNVGETATITIPVKSTNYTSFDLIVTVTVSDKDVPTIAVEDITKVYGNSITDKTILGTSSVEGTWTFAEGQELTDVSHSGIKTVVFTPNESEKYATVETQIQVTINKATITIKANNKSAYVGDTAPDLTTSLIGIDYTATGLVGSDQLIDTVTLSYKNTPNMNKAGTTKIIASGATAPNTDNYNDIVYVDGIFTVFLDTAALEEAITSAEVAKEGIITDDGTPDAVKSEIKFVSSAVMKAYDDALEQAKTTLGNATTLKEVNDAILAIDMARIAFEGSIQTGTYKNTQTLIFSKDVVTASVGDTLFEPVLSGAKTNVTFRSTNEAVAIVNAKGEVTILKPGVTTIIATAEETNEYYSGVAQYELKIEYNASTSNEAPNTGDNSNFIVYLIIAFISIAGIRYVTYKEKAKNK